jgi:hypothetical protein
MRILVLACLCLTGCNNTAVETQQVVKVPEPYGMVCNTVSEGGSRFYCIQRCENDEAVCYSTPKGVLSRRFKSKE